MDFDDLLKRLKSKDTSVSSKALIDLLTCFKSDKRSEKEKAANVLFKFCFNYLVWKRKAYAKEKDHYDLITMTCSEVLCNFKVKYIDGKEVLTSIYAIMNMCQKKAIDLYRKKSSKKAMMSNPKGEAIEDSHSYLKSPYETPLDALGKKDTVEKIDKCVDELGNRAKLIRQKYYTEKLSDNKEKMKAYTNKECANILGMKKDKFEYELKKCLKKLKECFEAKAGMK